MGHPGSYARREEIYSSRRYISTKPWVRVIGCPDTFGVLQAWSKESPILVGWEEPHGQRQVASYGRMHWTKVWI